MKDLPLSFCSFCIMECRGALPFVIISSETAWCLVQVQPGSFVFPGFEQQTAADQKNPLVPSNSTFSPNSTLFPSVLPREL